MMKHSRILKISAAVMAVLFVLGLDSSIAAQGRGNGGNRGGGSAGGMGRPSGVGVDRGMGRASDRSGGRADDGWGTASDRSNGRRDAGIDRARDRGENRSARVPDDNELNRYRGISKKLGITPEELRSRYLAASALNPDLSFGRFISANVVADNLHARYPSVTTAAILDGLQNGRSLGESLRDLRVLPEDAKAAEKEAKRRIKESREDD
jgi:hypothetical protein